MPSHFDMSQGQACQWIRILSEVLRLALGELGHLPERDPQKVKELLETYIDESQQYEPAGVDTHQPKKKPRGRELNSGGERAELPNIQCAHCR